MCRVDRFLSVAAVDTPDIVEKGLLEEAEAGMIDGLRMDGIVDYFETDKSYDGGCSGISGKEGDADLPGLGIGAQLVQELEGLTLESLIRRGIPGDLDRVLDLYVGWVVSKAGFGAKIIIFFDLSLVIAGQAGWAAGNRRLGVLTWASIAGQ